MQDCMQILNEFLGNNLSTFLERKKHTPRQYQQC